MRDPVGVHHQHFSIITPDRGGERLVAPKVAAPHPTRLSPSISWVRVEDVCIPSPLFSRPKGVGWWHPLTHTVLTSPSALHGIDVEILVHPGRVRL